jgi:hypothetical protein
MPRLNKIWPIVLILVGISLLCTAPPADAAFRLRVQDTVSGLGVVVTDEGPNDALAGIAGAISYSGSIGAWTVTVTTGNSKPLIGGFTNYSEMDLNAVVTSGAQAAMLGTTRRIQITLEDDTFTGGPDSPPVMQYKGDIGGTLGSGMTVTAQGWVNPANLTPALGPDTGPPPAVLGAIGAIPAGSVPLFPDTPAGPPDGITFTTSPYSASGSSSFSKSGPYALIAQVVVTAPAAGRTASFDFNQQTLPAPAGVVLALTALPFMGLGYLRRRLKRKAGTV